MEGKTDKMIAGRQYGHSATVRALDQRGERHHPGPISSSGSWTCSGCRRSSWAASVATRRRKRLISSNAVVSWGRRSTIVKAPIVQIIVVVLALAVGACSTGKPCAGPYGEPCGGPRSGWPGAVTCPSC